jgi:hypothetical protein
VWFHSHGCITASCIALLGTCWPSRFEEHDYAISQLAFSQDDKLLLTAGSKQ